MYIKALDVDNAKTVLSNRSIGLLKRILTTDCQVRDLVLATRHTPGTLGQRVSTLGLSPARVLFGKPPAPETRAEDGVVDSIRSLLSNSAINNKQSQCHELLKLLLSPF